MVLAIFNICITFHGSKQDRNNISCGANYTPEEKSLKWKQKEQSFWCVYFYISFLFV